MTRANFCQQWQLSGEDKGAQMSQMQSTIVTTEPQFLIIILKRADNRQQGWKL